MKLMCVSADSRTVTQDGGQRSERSDCLVINEETQVMY